MVPTLIESRKQTAEHGPQSAKQALSYDEKKNKVEMVSGSGNEVHAILSVTKLI